MHHIVTYHILNTTYFQSLNTPITSLHLLTSGGKPLVQDQTSKYPACLAIIVKLYSSVSLISVRIYSTLWQAVLNAYQQIKKNDSISVPMQLMQC